MITLDGYVYRTDNMSLAEMDRLKTEMEKAIDDIENQLQQAVAHRKQTGKYRDPKWCAAASGALKRRRREYQKLNTLMAAKRKALRQIEHQANRPLSDYFVEVCKERMPEELYEAVRNEALHRLEAALAAAKEAASGTAIAAVE